MLSPQWAAPTGAVFSRGWSIISSWRRDGLGFYQRQFFDVDRRLELRLGRHLKILVPARIGKVFRRDFLRRHLEKRESVVVELLQMRAVVRDFDLRHALDEFGRLAALGNPIRLLRDRLFIGTTSDQASLAQRRRTGARQI